MVPCLITEGEQNASVALPPSIFSQHQVPSYLSGILAAVGVLFVVFLIIVGTVGCYYYRRNKAVIMKVGIAQDGCCGDKELSGLYHHGHQTWGRPVWGGVQGNTYG